ncbi:MAG: hypothetical protein EA342_20250 [Leptolyngbya sp. LCM1.Bin17]|nr:MAG: hypothetical protein EA342_20250 [Leptolyngbya sp. LCM1.Bin17]
MSIAQTTQLLQLVLNSAIMMAIALAWWGIVMIRLEAISAQLQRLHQTAPRTGGGVSPYRHGIRVRYRLTRHSALIMHYVLLAMIASLVCLTLRALVNTNLLITVAVFLVVLGSAGILVSVALALLEFYHLNALEITPAAITTASPPGKSPARRPRHNPIAS